MYISSKVTGPKAKDLIAGDQDLGFFEEQVRQILDNTLQKHAQSQKIIGISYSILGIGYLMVYLINLHYSVFSMSPTLFLGVGLLILIMGLFSLALRNTNFIYRLNKRYANIQDWKKFLDSTEGAAKCADPRGRLEVLTMMVASMDSWLYMEKNVVIGRATLPMHVLPQIGALLIFIPRSLVMNDILFVLTLAPMIGGVVYGLVVLVYLEYRHYQIQKYWRPRLMTYWARLDSYRRMLWTS